MSLIKSATLAATLLAVMTLSLDASAQSVRVRCETGDGRSKVSVDGSDLASANYKAVIVSGSNRAESPYDHTFGDEVEFDFDSNRKDIAAGATAISPTFIVRGRVTGSLVDVNGRTVASQRATCRVR